MAEFESCRSEFHATMEAWMTFSAQRPIRRMTRDDLFREIVELYAYFGARAKPDDVKAACKNGVPEERIPQVEMPAPREVSVVEA